jgi:quercetin dioxygenase-like cupin family protein
MSDVESTNTEQKPRSNAGQSAVTVVQEAKPPFIPAGAHAMTVVVEFPPGDPGTPPHRHPGPYGCPKLGHPTRPACIRG